MADSAVVVMHVTPRAGRDEVVGVSVTDEKREVLVRVTAPPDAGKANKAVCALLAKELGVPKSSVAVKRGATSRHKILEVATLQESVDAWVSTLSITNA